MTLLIPISDKGEVRYDASAEQDKQRSLTGGDQVAERNVGRPGPLGGTGFLMRNPDVVLREEDEHGGLLFNPDTNQIHVINSTALVIWGLCDGSRDGAAITEEVCARFSEVTESVADDVSSFLEQMLSSGFIGVLSGGGDSSLSS